MNTDIYNILYKPILTSYSLRLSFVVTNSTALFIVSTYFRLDIYHTIYIYYKETLKYITYFELFKKKILYMTNKFTSHLIDTA